MPQGLIVLVSGPSGVGKSTVCKRLAAEVPAEFAVSATTRQGKPQDALGKKYEFVDEPTFKRLLEAGEFLEYACVFGHWYGTLKKPVQAALAAGRVVLLEIDVQGATQVHERFANVFGVFLLPASEDVLLTRLHGRGRDDEATIQRRFAEAKAEIHFAKTSNVYDLLVVNADGHLDATVTAIKDAIAKFRG